MLAHFSTGMRLHVLTRIGFGGHHVHMIVPFEVFCGGNLEQFHTAHTGNYSFMNYLPLWELDPSGCYSHYSAVGCFSS